MITNVPSWLVVFSFATLVSWLTILTLAAGTVAPEVSTTVPVTTAVGVCAGSATVKTKPTNANERRKCRIPRLLTGAMAHLPSPPRTLTLQGVYGWDYRGVGPGASSTLSLFVGLVTAKVRKRLPRGAPGSRSGKHSRRPLPADSRNVPTLRRGPRPC